MPKMITKWSGQQEVFKPEKLARSLRNVGVHEKDIQAITQEIESDPTLTTTKAIYQFAFKRLKKLYRPLATRYNLKPALFALGPTGFPFEQFISALFKKMGYTTKIDQTILGTCISHEIDVIAEKSKEYTIIETKYHNSPSLKSDVQVTLYVKARFDDIENYCKQLGNNRTITRMLITNTQFTAMAIQYALCQKMNLLGWGYPHENGLEKLLERYQMIPLTALTSITKYDMKRLIEKGCITCEDVLKHQKQLARILGSTQRAAHLIKEVEGIHRLVS